MDIPSIYQIDFQIFLRHPTHNMDKIHLKFDSQPLPHMNITTPMTN